VSSREALRPNLPVRPRALTADPAHSEAADDFFHGKQISLVIGYNPGGSYGAYGRIDVSSAVITRAIAINRDNRRIGNAMRAM
jgi:hypothetical protein